MSDAYLKNQGRDEEWRMNRYIPSNKPTFMPNLDKLSMEEATVIEFINDSMIHRRPALLKGKEKWNAMYGLFRHPVMILERMFVKASPEWEDMVVSSNISSKYAKIMYEFMFRRADISTKLIQQLIETSDIDHHHKLEILDFWEQNRKEVMHIYALWNKAKDIDLIQQWANGELDYSVPIFTSEDDVVLFFNDFQLALLDDSELKKKYPEMREDALKGLPIFRDKMVKHESMLKEQALEHAKQEEERIRLSIEFQKQFEEEERLRALEQEERAQKLAIEKALEEERAHEVFMSEHRPYVFEGGVEDAYKALVSFGKTTAQRSGRARLFADILKEVSQTLDIRDNGVREIGDILFSDGNLLTGIKAFDLDKQISQTSIANGDQKSRLETLQSIYAGSGHVRTTFTYLTSQDSGVFLLAALSLEAKRARSYASFLFNSYNKLEPFYQKIREFEQGISDFSVEDQAECRKDADYESLILDLEEKRLALKMDETREQLVDEISPIFQGTKPKSIAVYDIPEIARTEKISLPEKWLKLLKQNFHIAPSPNGDKYIQIHSNRVPLKFFDIKVSAGIQTLQSELARLRERASLHQANLETIKNLTGQYGFQMRRGERGLELLHSEYNIHVSLELNELEKTKAFDIAYEKFQSRQYQQKSMLQTALSFGVDIGGIDEEFNALDEVYLKYGNLKGVTIAPRGYFSSDDFKAIQTLLNQIETNHSASDVKPLSEDIVEENCIIDNWEPESGSHIFFFDTVTLNKLAATRGNNGHAWLDIIKCTAGLPDTKVIIPSIVADWEAQGKIPSLDQDRAFDQIDKRYVREGYVHEASASPIAKFLSTASRVCVANGQMQLQQNANPNIIIMDTDGDEDLYERIREIEKLQNGERSQAYQEQVHGKGEGEAAINRAIRRLERTKVSMTIVSDDIQYFKNGAPQKACDGSKINHLSTASYLGREIQKHESFLRARLRERSTISLHRIGEEIAQYWEQHMPDEHIFFVPWSNKKRLKPVQNLELAKESSDLTMPAPQ